MRIRFRIVVTSGLVAVTLVSGCRTPPPPAIEVTAGSSTAERITLVPRSALAEYTELGANGAELRILLASWALDCLMPFEPPPGQSAVLVTVRLPPKVALASGAFPWMGHDHHGGAPLRPDRSYSFPKVLLPGRSVELQPGGTLKLEKIAQGREGSISGVLAFDAPGDAQHPATSLKGPFSARMCRFELNPKR